jgi:hypothetical protein
MIRPGPEKMPSPTAPQMPSASYFCVHCGARYSGPPQHLLCSTCGSPVQEGTLPYTVEMALRRQGILRDPHEEEEVEAPEPSVLYGRRRREDV